MHDEGELPNTGLFGRENHAELCEGLCQSSFDPVVEKDAPEIVPLGKEFEVEECMVGSEPLDDDCWIGGKKEMKKKDDFCKESLLIESLCQANSPLRTELHSFGSEIQKVMKSFPERVCELEAKLDCDHSCREHVQANALALQAE